MVMTDRGRTKEEIRRRAEATVEAEEALWADTEGLQGVTGGPLSPGEALDHGDAGEAPGDPGERSDS
jgi:hypothetical protein